MEVRNIGVAPVHIAGRTLGPNRRMEIDDAEFEQWRKAGDANRQLIGTRIKIERIGPPPDDDAAATAPAPPTSDTPAADDQPAEGRLEALITAIGNIPRSDANQWTAEGKPTLQALRDAAAMTDINGAERDAAWEEYAMRYR